MSGTGVGQATRKTPEESNNSSETAEPRYGSPHDDCVGTIQQPCMLRYKDDFNYEGRVRIEKDKDRRATEYDAYLRAHPEVSPMLHDILQHVLIHQPTRPLKAIGDYVRARDGL